MPEARLRRAGVNAQTRIALPSPRFLSQFTRGPGTFRHTPRDPAFGTRQNFRGALTEFLPISGAHSPTLFRIQPCEVTHRRGNRNQTGRGCLDSLIPDATATLDPSGSPHLEFESAVLLLKGGAVLAVSGTLHRRVETRTFKVDGETCGPLSRRIHDRTSPTNVEDLQVGTSSGKQAVHAVSSDVNSALGCNEKTNIPRPSCSIA